VIFATPQPAGHGRCSTLRRFSRHRDRVLSRAGRLRIGETIPQIKRHRWFAAGAGAAVLALGGIGVASAPGAFDACTPSQINHTTLPCNDDYANLFGLNGPGPKLNDVDTIKDKRDTTNATVQTDIVNPPSSGGPPEVTSCHGVSYGKTVWYSFSPDRNGAIEIRTSGYDDVIALYRVDRRTALPQPNPQCVHQSSFPNQGLAKVKPGLTYAIQIGAVNGAAGLLGFKFDFFPAVLSANSTLKALATGTGIKLLGLSVSTAGTLTSAKAAHVQVSCGRFCRPEKKTGHATEKFPGLNGVQMPAGSQLQIRVTKKGTIGAYLQYNVGRGSFTRIRRCIPPNSRKPSRGTCH
jgi:hypothetical protein